MDPTIEATTDDRLIARHTTEYSCECPALFYKSKVYKCPWTGDVICSHMYRFRLRARHARILAVFRKVILPFLTSKYGDAHMMQLVECYRPAELERLEKELARQPEPKPEKKPRRKKSIETTETIEKVEVI